jgi:hypothetical protein
MGSRSTCPRCARSFARLETHLTSGKCIGGLASEPVEDCKESAVQQQDGGLLDAFLEDAAACKVADKLSSLRYERGFQRPDIEAAKDLAKVVGKRTRDGAFTTLQGLLRPDVDRQVFEAAMEAAEATAFKGVATERQEKAYMRRTLPMLDTRVTELGEGHRVVSIHILDAIIRLVQAPPTRAACLRRPRRLARAAQGRGGLG